MVVNSNGRAYTQRVEPKLALVEVEVPADSFNEDWEPTENSYLGMNNIYYFVFCPFKVGRFNYYLSIIGDIFHCNKLFSKSFT